MKAFLILEDGTVFQGMSIGSPRESISEIVFNTSMTGYLEVLTDPSYAGQAVAMTYPLIGNYGVTPDMESERPWAEGYIVRELSRMPSNFRSTGAIQDFLRQHDIPGIAGIDTRALTKILREKGTMNGMITTDEDYCLADILPRLKAYTTGNVVDKVTCARALAFLGIPRAVAEHDAVWLGGEDFLRTGTGRVNGHFAAPLLEGLCNILLGAQIQQSHALLFAL